MSQQQEDERLRRYHGAIKILAKTEEWPHFQEWLRYQILAMATQNNALIITEEDKSQHNARTGMLSAFKLVLSIDEMIGNAEEWENKMAERIKDAENQFKKGEK